MSSSIPDNPVSSSSKRECRCLPLVIVEGFLGRTGTTIWGDFQRYLGWECNDCRREVIFSSTGPVSSLHDRACELYYSLVGGIVDYGEEHSRIHGHARYGRTYSEGLYPGWSTEKPLHFLGHSVGGLTIVKLQHLLKYGHFGPCAHPDMIRSVNSISSPFRGTQVVYVLGERTDDAPRIRPFSWGSLLSKAVHLISFMSPLLPETFDLHTESRAMSYHETSFVSLLKQLWKSDWAESKDATPYDVTFESAEERESTSEGTVNPRTFYRSHATYITDVTKDSNIHSPPAFLLFLTPLFFMAQAIASFDFSSLKHAPSFLRPLLGASVDIEHGLLTEVSTNDLRANDGVVPVFSQWHPRSCSTTNCQHSKSKSSPVPGIWYVEELPHTHHLSLVPLWTSSSGQRRYWIKLGRWLREVESHCT
ncbi:alpha beta-hydrolase [Dendrothele bispora CBS 962.96]|uniref:Alpha beta-hydrolase n=1 Tax=Dendrothele bispora (strain CBS 962.96) TaxID=1314807 RepID=A0A4S8MWU5_DENBC|nr:alpha beta-hydrolase [Dendrothele bispora CBS 962.96]